MKIFLRLLASTLFLASPWLVFGEEEDRFSEAEIDQMLAPIALYPDALLAQILTASTYPLEIVEAHRWAQNHGLEGEEAVEAADAQEWDPSVKALVAFPNVLERMHEDLTWTQHLGEAVLLQEEEVMTSVQKLRAKAHEAGSLSSLENVEVRREKEIIYIEPANPQIVYVPYYQPTVVYGSWWWPAYPPVYWRPFTSISIRTGSSRIIWTHGYRFPSRYYYSHPDWHRRHIVIHHHYHKRPARIHRSDRDWRRYSTGNRWEHRAEHRRGVRYRSPTLREQYVRRHHPERQRPARGEHPIQRRDRVRDAENRRERRDGSAQNVTRPERRDFTNLERRARERQEQQRTRREAGSPERRETVNRNPDVSSEQIRQRLMRDRAQQQQRGERANVQPRPRREIPTGTDLTGPGSAPAQNQRPRPPHVRNHNRGERRSDGQTGGIRQRPSEERRSQTSERQQRPPRREQMQQRRSQRQEQAGSGRRSASMRNSGEGSSRPSGEHRGNRGRSVRGERN